LRLLDDPGKADEITRRILSGLDVSDAEYRYIVMFNLTAMTQILWELTGPRKQSNVGRKGPAVDEKLLLKNTGGLRSLGRKILPLLASLMTFLAGMGIGYLIP
jgi:hypothetical protein